MSKRNLILLIIILITITLIVLGTLYFRQPTTDTPQGGINFGSLFSPFGPSKPATPATGTPPTDISGYQPEPTNETTENNQLKKVSSMPVAGYVVFNKERLIDMPIPTETPSVNYNFGNTTLREGNTGDAISELQKFLNATLGLSIEINGIFDSNLTTAVKSWQKDHGLASDGVVGTKTKTAMYSSVGQVINPTPPPTELVPALRYVDRASGNIYETFVDKIQETKFTTTIIPKVYEAIFGNKGESVIMRYLKTDGKTIESFVGNLPKELLAGDTTDGNEIKGTFLPEDVKDLSLAPDTKSVFYLFNSGDNIVGTTLNLLTNKKTQIFDSPFTEWLSSWPNSKTITLTTKPSFSVPGYMYTKDLNSQRFSQVMGKINGLTTLMSPDGKMILYGNNTLALNLFHTDTKTVEPFGVKTLPEKCVWNKTSTTLYCAVPGGAGGSTYPDVWYQGEVSFSDQLWKIDIVTGNATQIIDPTTTTGGEEIDGIKLGTDETENYLFFVNKKDSFLWELKIK
ncbi:MAG: peptidoglycan-binding domain-containing protein [Candidatus Paceibacterota bacterium]|jgi:peptidoglycan hydrolase-like protein with peptidoglycan-binding domain